MLWLAGDVKEPTLFSKKVGHEVPGVVVWPLLCLRVGGKCSEILATIKLLYNPRVNKVFTSLFTGQIRLYTRLFKYIKLFPKGIIKYTPELIL